MSLKYMLLRIQAQGQFVNTGWPLMLTFVGMMFAWGVAQI